MDNNQYDRIIPNVNNQLVTRIYNGYYILIRRTNEILDLEKIIKNEKNNIIFPNSVNKIIRSNWVYLWSRKIDYIEYQIKHLENKYHSISNSVNYYIGMAENACFYVSNIFNEKENPQNENLVISHIRILETDFNNPLNIIVDYQARDVSEYLKHLFLKNKYNYDDVKRFLIELNLSEFGYKLVYGRLLFPTFYFDMYDKIINEECEEAKILEIIKRTEEYEDYISNIYIIINDIKKIPGVTWLN